MYKSALVNSSFLKSRKIVSAMVPQICEWLELLFYLSLLTVVVPLVNFKALDAHPFTEGIGQILGPLGTFLELSLKDGQFILAEQPSILFRLFGSLEHVTVFFLFCFAFWWYLKVANECRIFFRLFRVFFLVNLSPNASLSQGWLLLDQFFLLEEVQIEKLVHCSTQGFYYAVLISFLFHFLYNINTRD